MYQDFMRGTDIQQKRLLRLVLVAVVAAAAVGLLAATALRGAGSDSSAVAVNLDVPRVAPGVTEGTKVILRGVEIGQVTGLARKTDGAIRIRLSLGARPAGGLTERAVVDFLPESYFGVTAVSISPRPGGSRLASGATLARPDAGDYTMASMLQEGQNDVAGILTNDSIRTLEKTIRYVNALDPMIESGVRLADTVAKTQRHLPSRLMDPLNRLLQYFPDFNRQVIVTLQTMFDWPYNIRPDGSHGADPKTFDDLDKSMVLESTNLFGAAGTLLASHSSELPPVTDIVTALANTGTGIVADGAATAKITRLVRGFDRAFSGDETSKTLNLRVVIDGLPMISAPLQQTALRLPRPPGRGQR